MTNHHLVAGAALAIISLVGGLACGSDGPPATAEPGSTFCELSEAARDAGQDVDISAEPDDLQEQVEAAVAASKKAADASPKDFEDIAADTVDAQESLVALLEDYDYDFVAASTSPEGLELFAEDRFTEAEEERDEYLLDKCEIEPTDNTAGGDLTFATGDEGIRQLFALLQINPESEITEEQVECAVDGLSGGAISDEDVSGIANQGEVTDEGVAAFNAVVSECGIEIAG